MYSLMPKNHPHQTLWRLYTERKDSIKAKVLAVAAAFFPAGFTAFEGYGYYAGGGEPNLTLEVLTDAPMLMVHNLAYEIAKVNDHQQSVLAVAIGYPGHPTVDGDFICGGCGESFDTYDEFEKHYKTHGKR